MVPDDAGCPSWWRGVALLVVSMLAGAACSTPGEVQDEASPSVESAPVTTTVPIATTATVAATSSSIVEGSAEASYVSPTLGFVQSILPGGGGFVVSDGVEVCIEFIDGTGAECFPWQDGDQGRTNLVTDWDASGVRAAFFDRLQVATTFESSVWIMDINLGEVGQLLGVDDVLAYDVEMSPSGDKVALAGSSDGSDGIFIVDESNGIEQLAQTPSGDGGFIDWLPDGSGILLSPISADSDGLWLFTSSDWSSELIIPQDQHLGPPSVVGVSSDSRHALVLYRHFASDLPVGESYMGLVDLETRQVTPLIAQEEHFVGPVAAVFSPDGQSVAYAYHTGTTMEAPITLAVRSIAGDERRIISDDMESDFGTPPNESELFLWMEPGRAPIWDTQDRLYFARDTWVLEIQVR